MTTCRPRIPIKEKSVPHVRRKETWQDKLDEVGYYATLYTLLPVLHVYDWWKRVTR